MRHVAGILLVLGLTISDNSVHAARRPLDVAEKQTEMDPQLRVTGHKETVMPDEVPGSFMSLEAPVLHCDIVLVDSAQAKVKFETLLSNPSLASTVCRQSLGKEYIVRAFNRTAVQLIAVRQREEGVDVAENASLGDSDSEICGFAYLDFKDESLVIDTLCSHTGYGKLLMQAAEELGRTKHKQYSELKAVKSAYGFYVKNDYKSGQDCQNPCFRSCSTEEADRVVLESGLIWMKKCILPMSLWEVLKGFAKENVASIGIVTGATTAVGLVAYLTLSSRHH